jgi:hypothetical protein
MSVMNIPRSVFARTFAGYVTQCRILRCLVILMFEKYTDVVCCQLVFTSFLLLIKYNKNIIKEMKEALSRLF